MTRALTATRNIITKIPRPLNCDASLNKSLLALFQPSRTLINGKRKKCTLDTKYNAKILFRIKRSEVIRTWKCNWQEFSFLLHTTEHKSKSMTVTNYFRIFTIFQSPGRVIASQDLI